MAKLLIFALISTSFIHAMEIVPVSILFHGTKINITQQTQSSYSSPDDNSKNLENIISIKLPNLTNKLLDMLELMEGNHNINTPDGLISYYVTVLTQGTKYFNEKKEKSIIFPIINSSLPKAQNITCAAATIVGFISENLNIYDSIHIPAQDTSDIDSYNQILTSLIQIHKNKK